MKRFDGARFRRMIAACGWVKKIIAVAALQRHEEPMLNTVELKLELPANLTKDEVQTLLAVKLFEIGRVTLGQAAKLSGFSKRAFIEILGRQQVPVVNYSPDELRQELGL